MFCQTDKPPPLRILMLFRHVNQVVKNHTLAIEHDKVIFEYSPGKFIRL